MNGVHGPHKSGEVAEWSNAAVLKTVGLHGPGGSNPSLSASYHFRLNSIACAKPRITNDFCGFNVLLCPLIFQLVRVRLGL